MGNVNYSVKKTLGKGLDQLVTIVTSSAFAALIATALKDLTDKDFQVSDIKQVIEGISGLVVLMTPAISAVIQMLKNFYKNYFNME